MKPSALSAAVACLCCLLSVVWGNAISYVDEGCECAAKPSPSLVRWDKLFIMLEKSQKRESMMLDAVENTIRDEMQAVHDTMEKLKQDATQRLDRTLRDSSQEFLSHIDVKLQSETNGKFDKIERLLGKLLTNVQTITLELLSITQESTESPAVRDHSTPSPNQLMQLLGLGNLALSEEKTVWTLALFPPPGCFMTLHFPMRSSSMAARVHNGRHGELSALTLCLWARASDPLSKTVLASYGDRASPRLLQLYLSGDRAVFSVGGNEENGRGVGGRAEAAGAANRDSWAHYCGAWESESGDLTLWVNGQLTGRNSSPVLQGAALPPIGTLLLGQEGSAGSGDGGNAKTAFAGALAGFNVWDHVLASDEIAKLAGGNGGCQAKGNVVAWGVTEMLLEGGAVFNHY